MPSKQHSLLKSLLHCNKKKGELLAFVSVLIFACVLRIILFTGVLDYDVLDYAYLAYDATFGNLQFDPDINGATFRYGLYLPVAFFYAIFGPSEFSTILYPLLASLLGVTGIYGIARLIAGESAAIITALVWAALPLNVFLSTLFGPDSILATFTIAAVFFLILGNSLKGQRAIWCYLSALLLTAVAITVKPSAVMLLVFFAGFAFAKIYPWVSKRIRQIWVNLSKRAVVLIILVALVGLFVSALAYLQRQDFPFLLWGYLAATDLSSLVVNGMTQEEFPVVGVITHTNLLLAATPLFIISFAWLLVKKFKEAWLILLWAGTQFAYFEWGSIALNPLIYAPIVAVTYDRNILFILAPAAVLAGIYLSQGITRNHSRWLPYLAFLFVLPAALLAVKFEFNQEVQTWLAIFVAMAILGALASPYFMSAQFKANKSIAILGFVLITLVAFIYPTPPMHISEDYWERQSAYRVAVKQAAQLLMETPGYPILTLSPSNAMELNFLSNFQLGHASYLSEPLPNARIVEISDPTLWVGSAYIFLRDEINQIAPVPPTWWKVAEFETGTDRPLVVFRTLSLEDARNELISARTEIENEETIDNYEDLLAAAVNAGDMASTVEAWIWLNAHSAATFPIDLISPIVINQYLQNPNTAGENLLFQEDGSNDYDIDPLLQESSKIDVSESGTTISITLRENLGGQYGIYKYVELKPGQVYLFVAEVKSTMGVDLLRIGDINAQDSHSYSNVYGEWEEVSVVFVTPDWVEVRSVRVDLLTLNKSGVVSLRNPRLYLLQTGN